MKKLVLVTFILLAVPAQAKLQYVFVVDTVDQFSQWALVGTGNHIQVLNDGVDANYIQSTSAADTIIYLIGGLPTYDYEHLDIVDSVVYHLRVRNFSGVANFRTGLRIGTDITWATTIGGLSGSGWESVERSFVTPPGSRGSWDKVELDSSQVLFNPVTIPTDTVAVTACSVFVYTTLAVPSRLYFTNVTGCQAGSNFGKEFTHRKPVIIDTVKVVVPANTTENDYFTLNADCQMGSASWSTGGFSVHLNLIKQVNPDSVRVRVSRMNDNCVVQESTPYTAKTSLSGIGEKIINIPAYDWSNGLVEDDMRLEFEWTNPVAAAEDSLWFTVGMNESRLDYEFSSLLSCLGGMGVACGGSEDTMRVADTTANMQNWGRYNAYGFQKDTFQITAFQESYGTGATAKLLSLQDKISGTAIFEQTQADSQRFTLENTMIPASSTFQSLNFYARVRRKNNNGGVAFLRMRLMMDGNNTNYCESGDFSLTSAYALYTFQFTGTPTAAGSCGGSLDSLALDSINVVFMADSVLANDTIYVGQFDAYVCYVAAGGAPAPKRRRRLLLSVKPPHGDFVITQEQPVLTVPIWGRDD